MLPTQEDTLLHSDAGAFAITKSYRGDNGEMFIEGIASTVDIDQTGARAAGGGPVRRRQAPPGAQRVGARSTKHAGTVTATHDEEEVDG